MSEVMELEVLNTGAGHLRITYDPGAPEEVEKARKTVEVMLLRGFALFVDTGDGQLKRVKGFNANTGCYLVEAVPDTTDEAEAKRGTPEQPKSCYCGRPARHRGRHAKTKPVPAKGTKAVAVGRTAGG